MSLRCPLTALMGLCLASTLAAQAEDTALTRRVDGRATNPSVPAVRAETAPTMDGRPDEPCWTGAPVLSGFTHDTRPTPLETEARVMYTSRAIYVAFTCHDDVPDQVRGQQRKRNGNLGGDDTVSIGIDPRFDKQSAYWFTVNAAGTQAEDIPGGAASKVEWRGDWRAATQVTSDGWTAEMEIPFELLRYPRQQETFGLLLARHIPRLREDSNWPSGTHHDNRVNEARWGALQTPRQRPRPRIMPYALGGSGTFESSSGLDMKYTTENDSTLLLTLRPDFQTIEDSIEDVDFSYNAKRRNDRRPFFTEGGDFLDSHFEFHSPSISEVDAGAKAFGRTGPYQFAGLVTSHFHQETDAVGVLGWDPNTTLSVWGGAASRRWRDPQDGPAMRPQRNLVWMAGSRYWLPLDVNGVEGVVKYFRSRSEGSALTPGSDGHQFRAELSRWSSDGILGGGLTYREITPDYDAQLSYMPEVDVRGVNGWIHYPWQVKRGALRGMGFYTSFDWTNRYSGGLLHRGTFSILYASFRNDTGASLVIETGTRDNDRATLVPGPNGEPGSHYNAERVFDDRVAEVSYSWRESDIYRGGGVSLRFGRLAGGPYFNGDMWQGARFGPKASGSLSLTSLALDGPLDRQDIWRIIASGLYEFSDERSVALRVILGRESVDGEVSRLRNAFLAYRQEVRRGADIFVLLGDPNANGMTSHMAVKYVVTY